MRRCGRPPLFLRKAVGDGVIGGRAGRRGGGRWRRARSSVMQTALFAEALARAHPREALALYRGDLLAGFRAAAVPLARRRGSTACGTVSRAGGGGGVDAGGDAGRVAVGRRRLGRASGSAHPGRRKSGAVRLMRLSEGVGDPNRPPLRVFEGRCDCGWLRRAGEPGAHAAAKAAQGSGCASRNRCRAPITQGGRCSWRSSPSTCTARRARLPARGAVALLATALDGLADLHTLTSHAVLSALAAEGAADVDAQARAAERLLSASHVLRGTVVVAGGRLRIALASIQTTRGAAVARAQAQWRCADRAVRRFLDAIVLRLVTAPRRGAGRTDAAARRCAHDGVAAGAARLYFSGERAFRLGRYRDAVAAFEEAVAADTEASRWRGTGWPGPGRRWPKSGPAREAPSRAMAHCDRLAPHDRLLVEAPDAPALQVVCTMPSGAYLVARYSNQPDDVGAWYLLGDALFPRGAPYRGRSVRDAREPLRRALALDPAHVGAPLKARAARRPRWPDGRSRGIQRAVPAAQSGC